MQRFLASVLTALVFACGGQAAQTVQTPATPPPSFFGAEYVRVNLAELRQTPLAADAERMAQRATPPLNQVAQTALRECDWIIAGTTADTTGSGMAWLHFSAPKTNLEQELRSWNYVPQNVAGMLQADVTIDDRPHRIVQVSPQEVVVCETAHCAAVIQVAAEHARRRREAGAVIEPLAYTNPGSMQVVYGNVRFDARESLGMVRNFNPANQNMNMTRGANQVPTEFTLVRNNAALVGHAMVHETSAQNASAIAAEAQQGIDGLRGNMMVGMFGGGAIVGSLRVAASGNDVNADGVFPFGDLSRILVLVGAQLLH